ncbi:MurR/RpiR family transcriptional regulator [Saccharococcus caldoxylosilyticus]|uniref:MurR/RpiR family transcriptional regulator n=1 Tax=Saccharococcus caldoxylosilyticus TaxID=81408 RepID=UPI001FCC6143|nr:MurR/RpiR family transcriptional regulator [Parageobacillus caldoxylosilyticus]BDG37594.1 RpiR family transcriptional regulator [Parageobacillus caldoxylosilyticus]BDG41386.1 RpiR family transcriptional regulator [Parageobacillus caldoxylosilyticus]
MFTPEQIARFSELDYIIYNYVTKHANEIVYMRIRELADAVHVSPPTILRFCKKVGCDGFSEFKTKLKLYLQQNERSFITNAQDTLAEFFERTLKTDYQQTIREAAAAIARADNVIFVGSGSSGILAEYGSRYFSALKKFSVYIKDPFFPIYGHYFNNCVAIALSVSGETSYTLSQVHRLKEKGSTIISITNRKHCSLAKMSDYNLTYYVNTEFVEQTNVTTQIPVIYLLESLAKEMYRMLNGPLA